VRTTVDVSNFLVEREVPHELFSASGRLRSPKRMAAVLDLPPQEVGRVVLFEGPRGPVAAVVPCEAEPDPVLVALASGQSSVEPASDDRASELTGYLPESIPPVGLPAGIRLVLDPALDRDDVLYFPGGEVRAVLKVRGRDLARATGALVCPIVFHWPGA
jgi:prolyl-tRNA editing enzyme YbaK/EbsC (Cys-tRNA(Pro) deacylase)